MPAKKKKATASAKKFSKSQAGKPAPPKKAVASKKKSLSKKRRSLPQGEIKEYFGQASGRSSKVVLMEILKKIPYRSFGRRFQIRVLKDTRRKRLVFDVVELVGKDIIHIAGLGFPLKMSDSGADPEDVRGYGEILALVKKDIDTLADTMLGNLKQFLWSQFGASIDMLQNAIQLWPDSEWATDRRFFYNAYHTLVFLDYYLRFPSSRLSSSLPFTITAKEAAPAEAIDDLVPDKIYSKQELLEYGGSLRSKCKFLITSLTEGMLNERWVEKDGDRNYVWMELLFHNMRHVQHHAAQLNMMLRQKAGAAPDWVSRVKDQL